MRVYLIVYIDYKVCSGNNAMTYNKPSELGVEALSDSSFCGIKIL